MTMKRLLQCVLVLLALTIAACSSGREGDSSSKKTSKKQSDEKVSARNPDQPPPISIDSKGINQRIQDLSKELSQRPKPKVKEVTKELDGLIKDLDVRCSDCSTTVVSNLATARKALSEAKDILKDKEPDEEISQLKSDLEDKLEQASRAVAAIGAEPLASPTSSPAVTTDSHIEDSTSGLIPWEWLWTALYVAGGLFVLSLLAVGVQHLRKQSQQNFQANLIRIAEAQRSAIREAHKDLDDKLTSLSAAQKDLSRELVDLHTEVRSMARMVRESSSDRNDHRRQTPVNNYQPQWEEAPVKDEPEFPVSADDYLRKMDRYANVVKPDFQNGILVDDPEGKGELILIRDSRLADEAQPLFVVPCATHFQTKQDFYTHYEKYYECPRPMAGDVWILGPAVVEKVTGGWRLREKGMLEIRS